MSPMSYLRIQWLLVIGLSLSTPALAAGADDLDPRILLAPATDQSGECKQANTTFQSVSGSITTEGERNLCFGSQSISAASTGAVARGAGQPIPPTVQNTGAGSGGSSASRSSVLTTFFSSGGDSGSGPSDILSGGGAGGGGGGNVGAPGPTAGTGLPFLVIAGAYALFRRRARA